MANWMKQVTKNAGHVLQPGEAYVAALQFNRSSVMDASSGAGAVGGIVGEVAARAYDKRRDRKEAERQDQVAGETGVPEADVAWPGSTAIVGVTDRRILFFGTRGLAKPGDLFLEIPFEELTDVQQVEVAGNLAGGRVKTAQVRFGRRDGTAVSAHTPNLGVQARRLQEFLAALAGARGA